MKRARERGYNFVIRLRTSTSLSTSVSSKVCFRNLAFLNIRPHCGHGAGPKVNIRSIHVSHLLVTLISSTTINYYIHFVVTFRVDQEFEVRIEVLVRLTYRTSVVDTRLCDHHPRSTRHTTHNTQQVTFSVACAELSSGVGR